MGTAWGVLVAAATLLVGSEAIAEQNEVALSNLQVSRATLDNGLRVVMNQDHTVPTVAVSVYYDVGSRNEVKGRSGFAHLFEHMMFQGSANVGKGEHFSLIINRGGSANGTTSNDRTNYFETLPSNELALGLWLEADRMRSLVDHPGELREPADDRHGRAPPANRQPALHPEHASHQRAGLRRLLAVRALDHWRHAGFARRAARGRPGSSSIRTTRQTTRC